MPHTMPLLDQAAFDQAKQMLQQRFDTVLGYFIEDSHAYIASIEEGVQNRNVEMIMAAAHTIKSSARQLGAMRLSALAAELEAKAREEMAAPGKFPTLVPLAHDVRQCFEETERQLVSGEAESKE